VVHQRYCVIVSSIMSPWLTPAATDLEVLQWKMSWPSMSPGMVLMHQCESDVCMRVPDRNDAGAYLVQSVLVDGSNLTAVSNEFHMRHRGIS